MTPNPKANPMIFATVGTQLPFDRLLTALDNWAAHHPETLVVAQTGASTARFDHLSCRPHLDQSAFAAHVAQARVIVGHAGMGTILQAAEAGKPLILLPRRAVWGEHRTDHQLATAVEMAVLSNVTVIDEAADLAAALDHALSQEETCQPLLPATAEPRLIDAVREFIWPADSPPPRRLMGWVRT